MLVIFLMLGSPLPVPATVYGFFAKSLQTVFTIKLHELAWIRVRKRKGKKKEKKRNLGICLLH